MNHPRIVLSLLLLGLIVLPAGRVHADTVVSGGLPYSDVTVTDFADGKLTFKISTGRMLTKSVAAITRISLDGADAFNGAERALSGKQWDKAIKAYGKVSATKARPWLGDLAKARAARARKLKSETKPDRQWQRDDSAAKKDDTKDPSGKDASDPGGRLNPSDTAKELNIPAEGPLPEPAILVAALGVPTAPEAVENWGKLSEKQQADRMAAWNAERQVWIRKARKLAGRKVEWILCDLDVLGEYDRSSMLVTLAATMKVTGGALGDSEATCEVRLSVPPRKGLEMSEVDDKTAWVISGELSSLVLASHSAFAEGGGDVVMTLRPRTIRETVRMTRKTGDTETDGSTSGGKAVKLMGVEAKADRVVVVLDGSGSMVAGGAFGWMQREVLRAAAALDEKQEFQVLVATNNALIPCPAKRPVPASAENKRKLAKQLQGIRPEGRSDMEAALLAAVKSAGRGGVVFFVSDGVVEKPDAVLKQIKAANRGVSICTVLVGDQIKEAVKFMKNLASQNDGKFRLVGD